MEYLSTPALEALAGYEYKASGYTKLDNALTPFWNWAVSLVPRSVAPNTLTVVALACNLACSLLVITAAPTLSEAIPAPTCLAAALLFHLYVTLDAIDGKQARRTRTSSPLGELFDHGCDAFAGQYFFAAAAASLRLGPTPIAAGIFFGVSVPWILGVWEEYHTAEMRYSNGYLGVTEGEYFFVFVLCVNAATGGGPWQTVVIEDSPLGPFTLGAVVCLVLVSAAVCQGLTSVWTVLTFDAAAALGSAEDARRAMGRKRTGAGAALAQLLPLVIQGCAGALWVYSPHGTFASHPCLVLFFLGLDYATIASKLIIAHTTKSPFNAVDPSQLPLVVAVVATETGLVPAPHVQTVLLFLYAVKLAVYGHYVLGVMGEICAFLDIKPFTVRVPTLKMRVLDGTFGVYRFAVGARVPPGLLETGTRGGFVTVSRTADELSVVASTAAMQACQDIPDKYEGPFRCMQVVGPLAFEMVGVLARLSNILANANISIFVVSTYDTDYLMVADGSIEAAANVLSASPGIEFDESPLRSGVIGRGKVAAKDRGRKKRQ